MIRRDCLSKCRRDRAYCYCKSDAIHMFSDVIHVSTLLDIRPFLTIFGFSKPKFFLGGGYTNVVPPRLRSRFRLFYVGKREGNAFFHDARMLGSPGVAGERVLLLFVAFACVFAVIIAALSARHYRPNASARKSRCRISRFSATVSSLVICVMPVSGRNVCLRPAAISAWLRRRLCAIVTLSSANP